MLLRHARLDLVSRPYYYLAFLRGRLHSGLSVTEPPTSSVDTAPTRWTLNNDRKDPRRFRKPRILAQLVTDPLTLVFVKDLTWLLRHGAASEGLGVTPDGYVRVHDVVNAPPFDKKLQC